MPTPIHSLIQRSLIIVYEPGDRYAATAFVNAASEMATRISMHLFDHQLLMSQTDKKTDLLFINILLAATDADHWFCQAKNSNLMIANLQCRGTYGTLVMKFLLAEYPVETSECLRLIIEFNEKGIVSSVRVKTPDKEFVLE